MIALALPFPPSVNHYWRNVNGRVLISKQGRAYRKEVGEMCMVAKVKTLTRGVGVKVRAYPPDRRRRDLDNLLKALLDALQHGGMYEDDSQIDEIQITRGIVVPGGAVDVEVYAI